MLRVGLTGGLGSGKSTVGRLFAELGVKIIDADQVGRDLMQPGQAVFQAIIEHFGPALLRPDGSLDRRALADLAFSRGRLQELNQIVHPPVIAVQEEWLRQVSVDHPQAIAMIESALIFEASGEASGDSQEIRGKAGSVPGWRDRFDRILLVTAPDEQKIRRFVERSLASSSSGDPALLEEDARKRLAAQIPDAKKIDHCDWVIDNSGSLEGTREQVHRVHTALKADASAARIPIK